MKPTQDKYPHFEANQVLTNSHLNQVFDYLDEQERLTRANLIGIGIVCGLEFRVESTGGITSIAVSRGTGVGSAGYLLNEPDDVTLVSFREYALPNEIAYPAFKYDDAGILKQYPLWELFPAGEPNTTPLDSPSGFMADKVLVLFLELKMEGLRNCSPNDCNDKGNMVTATLRRLLIRIADMEKIIAAGHSLQGNLTLSDLELSLTNRMNLADIRLPRWDVPNTAPVTTPDVLEGFHNVFTSDGIADATGKALQEAYQAFRPLLVADYPSNPFAGFAGRFGFLDNSPVPVGDLKFMQYYYGFFEDLLNAYDEFRRKGIRLICACCPPEDLFPRHLMLGVVNPASVNNPEIFRNRFIPSPANTGCGELMKEVRQLFMRLVEMTLRFTSNPPLPSANDNKQQFLQIRITPDKLADVSLSEKAIPYYYLQNAPPHLYRLWNYSRTSQGRANQNQGYRADEYVPAAPDFVVKPLRYDLEPYNFLRIEGHLGLNYQAVLSRILSIRRQFRLPIDVIALSTGIFDEKTLIRPEDHSCHFTDLETLYDSRSGELIGFLGGNLRYFYDLFFAEAKGLIDEPIPSIIPWFVAWDPDFRVKPGTLGAFLEKKIFNTQLTAPYYDPDNLTVNLFQFINNTGESQKELILIYIAYYIARFPDVLPENLQDLDINELSNREKDITRVAEAIELKHEQFFTENEQRGPVVKWEDLDDRLEALVYGHYSDSIKVLLKEYANRLKELTKKLYLAHYLRSNPGIQHKAGVPFGGTFILVYHGESRADGGNTPPRFGNFIIRGQVVMGRNEPLPGVAVMLKGTSTGVKTDVSGNFLLRTKQLPVTLRVGLAGFRPYERLISDEGFYLLDLLDESSGDDQGARSDFFAGEVIADFYLPYLCNSDCSPIQFVLPVVPPSFTVETGCTGDNGNTRVIVTPAGGSPPYLLKINDGNFSAIDELLTLSPGEYTMIVQDSGGLTSVPQVIVVPAGLTLGEPNFDCTGDNNRYVAAIEINGGTPPYSSNIGRILNEKTFFGEDLAGDTDIEVIITDSRNCSASVMINHSCGPELAFSTRIGCANADDFAPVEVIPSGGTAPYEVQVGTEPFVPVGDPVFLPAGKHILMVRDASGTTTAPQEIEIATMLRLREPNFNCIGNNNEYITTIRIIGGQAPYTANRGTIERNTYVSDPLPGDTDVEIIISDSRNCSVSLTVRHSCLPDLSFSVNTGCTSANGAAVVEIIPSGGIAPYEIQTGTGAFVPLADPINLPPGSHQLTLRDSALTTVSQSLVIPDALTVSLIKFACDEENRNYFAALRISGGTPPYIASGVVIAGTDFSTDAIPNGETFTVQVSDDNKCSASIEIQHSCDGPCELPCEGETMACAYRLWLQPPTKTEAYEVYLMMKEVSFRFNGQNINLPNAPDLLQTTTIRLNRNFNNAIAALIKNLNEAINQALTEALGTAGNNRLHVSFDPQASDPFSVLKIEHFVCDTFNIEFSYRFGKPNPIFTLTARYSNELSESGAPFNGAVFINHDQDNKQSVVPAFDCGQRNQCSDGDFVKLCKENNLSPDFNIQLFRTLVNLESTTPGNITAWIWDITGSAASEPFYTGEKVSVIVAEKNANIRLSVISPQGCFAFTDKELNR
ncbi:MAG: carboxypeptidase-like regulatory domain-containing protein [Bacteroidales bacterium]|nr:carboxypeptidase-like regulatory domain-containing protein [Bacteroidales bacterium]